MYYLFSLLFFLFPLAAYDITVAGTGFSGVWAAYALSQDLEQGGLGDQVTLHVVGQWNWQQGQQGVLNQEISAFTHETSGWGPVGIQPHTGTVWNPNDDKVELFKSCVGNKEARYYISPDLEDEG